jgi:hypothetical protein
LGGNSHCWRVGKKRKGLRILDSIWDAGKKLIASESDWAPTCFAGASRAGGSGRAQARKSYLRAPLKSMRNHSPDQFFYFNFNDYFL